MESWVTSLLKDIGEKVGISGPPSTITAQSSISTRDYEAPLSTDKAYDYYPSRLTPSELRLLVQYVLQMRLMTTTVNQVDIMGRLLFMEDLASESASSAPCLEMDMSKMGHACISVPLGERQWPPESGYTFVCWFQFRNLKSQINEHSEAPHLRLFSVCPRYNDNTFYEELYLHQDGILTLATANTSSQSSSSLELEDGQWYHLAVVHSKINEDLTSILQIYLDGKLRYTGEQASSPVIIDNWLVTIGIPAKHARVSDLCWKLRSWYLFGEKLSTDCIRFMYILGQGYKVQVRSDNDDNLECSEVTGKDAVWNLEMLEKLWLELSGKNMLCAFNAARIEALRGSKTLALLNLFEPLSTAAPAIGVPLFGHFHGDVFVCRRCVTGNIIHPITEIAVVLALIESADTNNMLHIALKLLASALHENPTNVKEMKTCTGYHLLSLFLKKKISFFDIQCLEILFKISVSEDSTKLNDIQTNLPSFMIMPQDSLMDNSSAEFHEEIESNSFNENIDNFSPKKETLNCDSELENSRAVALPLISGALTDADMVELVLLDWTIWVTAPHTIQLGIVNFLEDLVSVYKYKDHNLSVLRERHIVHHLLVTLHRDDVELIILEKLAILLCIILEDKFLDSQMESMATFVVKTFDPPEVMESHQVLREAKSKRVTLRNILLEALVDLQVTIASNELLEQWHSILSSRLITCFLDEAVHPTSMVWIITLLGCCLTSSPIFPLKFQTSGGYKELVQVLPRFHDSLDIYYALFCLMFGIPIYPKLPELGILDLEALMPTNGHHSELRFSGLLDSIIAMAKASFDQPRGKLSLAVEAVNTMQTTDVASVEENKDILEEVSSEAMMDRTCSARLTKWEASAANATSILRLMANLAKMWPSFSYTCGQAEFLESCVDLYFSILRAYIAVKSDNESNVVTNIAESSDLPSRNSELRDEDSISQKPTAENACSLVNVEFLMGIDDSGFSGDQNATGTAAALDLIAEVVSDSMIRQISAVSLIESIFESIPLHFDSDSVLIFQGLCIGRIMNCLERQFLQDDEGKAPKLDKISLWSNLGSFCNVIVDCVYLGVFSRPGSVIRVLEFCLTMLHYAKKDGQMTETSLPWTGLLSIWRGSRPVDAILKSTNRMLLYCFLPSFLGIKSEHGNETPPPRSIHPGEVGFEEVKNGNSSIPSQEEIKIDYCIVLELLHAHKQIIFNPSNLDVDFHSSLCINLIAIFTDYREEVRDAAISIFKYLLVHCRAALETVLIEKNIDLLNGGFDRLLTENVSDFMHWFQSSEHHINQVLQQNAGVKWSEYVEESRKFRGERLKLLEDRRRRKMAIKVEEAEKRHIRYKEQCAERRYGLEAICETVCSELEASRQKKWESSLNAEHEWRTRFQQLGHQHKLEPVSAMAWEDYCPMS